MRLLFTFIFALFISVTLFSQIKSPGCEDLRIENIYIDSTGYMYIDMSNSCPDCQSGLNGCVYMQLEVIRTVAPLDTIASSSCWCFWSPQNGSQSTYKINSEVNSIPPLNEIRVSFMNCGCDSIPFSSASSVNTELASNGIKIYPNPAGGILNFEENKLSVEQVEIYNPDGVCVIQSAIKAGERSIGIGNLSAGMYLIRMISKGEQVTTQRFIKL